MKVGLTWVAIVRKQQSKLHVSSKPSPGLGRNQGWRFWVDRVLHGDLAAAFVIFGLVIFTKVKLHPPSSMIRNGIH